MTALLVGVISDTHGLLRPEAVAGLQGSDVIIHAGDIGSPEVIERLRQVAPTFAVRGNNDKEAWAADVPLTQVVRVGDLLFYVLHEGQQLDLDPAAMGYAAVVTGHSHRPSIQFRDGVLFLNPGSAGPRRFKLPVVVARVRVVGSQMQPEIVELGVKPPTKRLKLAGRGRIILGASAFAIASFVLCSILTAAPQKENDGCRKDETKTDQGCFKNPRLIHKAEPEYPPEARRHRVGGSVTLEGRLNEQGTVDDIKVVNAEATGVSFIESFQQAAIAAFKKWRCRPATIDGKPVAVDLTVTVDFIL